MKHSARFVHSPFALLLFVACGSRELKHEAVGAPASTTTAKPGETVATPPKGSSDDSSQSISATFYDNVLPLLESRCLSCHQDNGIAPIRLDSVKAVNDAAELIEHVTAERVMPPWGATADGSCGSFRDSIALSDSEIQLFSDFAQQRIPLGNPRAFKVPEAPHLAADVSYQTPRYTPEAEGGEFAHHDDYRCFSLDVKADASQFITGYSVSPGTAKIVHHVVAFIVRPDAASDVPGKSNAEVMAELHASSPKRDGWPCFGAAGDGVAVTGVPVVWAPGQGVVKFPADSGAPLSPEDKLVIQMHYNLEDPAAHGLSDSTRIDFQLQDQVKRVGLFVVPDPFLSSYFDGNPETLQPGLPSVKYTWKQSMADLGVAELPDLQLAGVMPHMHELGHRFQMRVEDTSTALGNALSGEQCGVNVDDWDFHWQRMYFYNQPIALPKESSLSVTCDYNTLARTEAILPGWGTQNEMCAAILYLTAPVEAFQ